VVAGRPLLAVFVTYTRLPPAATSHFAATGVVDGGLSRTLVQVGYPVAIAAIPLAACAVRGGGRRRLERAAREARDVSASAAERADGEAVGGLGAPAPAPARGRGVHAPGPAAGRPPAHCPQANV
jgi:hypothetical protein